MAEYTKVNFPDINAETLKLIENGTLTSLKTALSQLRTPDQVYNNQQIILLNTLKSYLIIMVFMKEKRILIRNL